MRWRCDIREQIVDTKDVNRPIAWTAGIARVQPVERARRVVFCGTSLLGYGIIKDALFSRRSAFGPDI